MNVFFRPTSVTQPSALNSVVICLSGKYVLMHKCLITIVTLYFNLQVFYSLFTLFNFVVQFLFSLNTQQ
jgi:hypothetical protein